MSLPETSSPFKFLDPYNQDDYKVFFGREKESQRLYEFVNRNRIVLLYGLIGTGKTSLIQCGLSHLFDPSDWIPLFIRRGSNINESLLRILHEKVSDQSYDLKTSIEKDDEYLEKLSSYLKEVFGKYLRPVYLIFDQFEEFLIMGTDEEKERFVKAMQQILKLEGIVGCHIIIVMREEYFAWLDSLEEKIPGISDRRLRVEPMRSIELKNVIQRSCSAFNIKFENPDKNAEQIINLLSSANNVTLPYMQVCLDQLWRIDFQKTYPNGLPGDIQYPELHFTTEEIREFGQINDVLQRFMIESKSLIESKLRDKFKVEDAVEILNQVLDLFVSAQGTKVTIPYKLINESYEIGKHYAKIENVPRDQFNFIIESLEERRILRNDGHSLELAHDAIARLIDLQRDARQKKLNGIRWIIQDAYRDYKVKHELLPFDLVKKYQPEIEKLGLRKKERDFFQKSLSTGEDIAKNKARSEFEKERKRTYAKLLIGFLLFSLLGSGYLIFFLIKESNSGTAMAFAHDLRKIPDKNTAIQLGFYIHDYGMKSDRTLPVIEYEILKTAQDPQYQASFALFNASLASQKFEMGDIDISRDGKYIVVRDIINTTNTEGEIIQDTTFILSHLPGKRDTAFKNIAYAYFLNQDNFLLLAHTPNNRQYAAHPTKFSLWDCEARTMKEFNIDFFLPNKETVYRISRSPYDNHKIRFLENGHLMVPGFSVEHGVPVRKLALIDSEKKVKFINSDASVSLGKDAKQLLVFRLKPDHANILYDQYGNEKKIFPKIYFADFTENDDIVYIDRDTLKLYYVKTLETTAFPQEAMEINYAFADSAHAIIQTKKGQVSFIQSLSGNKQVAKIKGRLINFDFKERIVLAAPDDSTLELRNFQGKLLDSLHFPEPILKMTYNQYQQSLLVLTRTNEEVNSLVLYKIDHGSIVRQAGFALTPNDQFGFCLDGSKFYYLRNNLLSVFNNNNEKLTDLLQFESLQKFANKYLKDSFKGKDFDKKRKDHGIVFIDQFENYY